MSLYVQKLAFSYIVTLIKIKKLILLTINHIQISSIIPLIFLQKILITLHLVQVSSFFGSETVSLSYLSWLWIFWCIQALKWDFSVIFSQMATNLFTLQPTTIYLFPTSLLLEVSSAVTVANYCRQPRINPNSGKHINISLLTFTQFTLHKY